MMVLVSSLTFPSSASASTVYTFTNAAATGNTGPTQAQINTAYASTTLAGAVTINTQGVQEWTVPFSGQFRITARGAAGGNGFYGNSQSGGFGAQTIGTFSLTSGTVLKVLVGQLGGSRVSNGGGGGGGGSFVVTGAGTILAIAGGGGGGGGRTSSPGVNASLTTTATADGSGAGTAGTSGGGGNPVNSFWCGAGAGGYSGNGVGYSNCVSVAGNSFTNGGAGGAASGSYAAAGGFGGGGGVGYAGGGGGGYNGAPGGVGNEPYPGGGGGSTFNSGSNVTTSQLNTLSDGGVTIQSLGPSLTTFAPRSTITNQTTIVYDIVFSEAVTGLALADFSKSGTGSASCTIGSPSGSGTTYTVTLSGCSPGTVILTIAANAVTNTSSQTAPASNTAAATVTIDQTAPTISSVTAPANKTYIPSETPTFTVAFSESVTVTGAPRLTLTVGSSTEYANFLSMSDSRTALFRYTVASDPVEFDTDGISLSTSLDLNSGTIRDLATNTLSNTSLSAPTLTSVLVAQPPAAPTIDSITATSGTLTVYFTPGVTRGSAITNYTYATNGTTFKARTDGTTASPLVITTVSTGSSNLTNGQGYQIRLRAISNAGTSDSSTVVNETPTAVSVTGDSTLILTYGSSASTSSYSATGGTNTYTWSLGSTLTGITLSGTTVTAGATTPAGTYSQTVRATDTGGAIGTRSLTITVNKASTTITIALPDAATSAALGGAVTITATVPRAGAVNFRLGGTTISGCGSATAASTTATCSWTPASLGSVSLTAIFTPTDTSNFETSTSTTLSITVVNGVSTVTLSLAGGTTTAPKGQAINIIAAVDQAGRVTFFVDGKRVPRCINKAASVGNVNCSWKPAVQKAVNISARLVPTNNVFNPSVSSLAVQVVRRSGLR
jgi:hypothetical protein